MSPHDVPGQPIVTGAVKIHLKSEEKLIGAISMAKT
jgi:hypothetical protein